MDGVFMRKLLRTIIFCCLLVCLVWLGALAADRQTLKNELVRFHVVAASDSAEDQAVKLQVRDAVISSLQAEMQNMTDVQQAKAYLQESLPKIRDIANRTLAASGMDDQAEVSLCLEEFTTRVYDTFSLPAGIYESLRITIGEGQGRNWWCVVFPSLCLPATAQGFEDVACSAGFSEIMTDTLAGDEEYEIRFFLLDAIGSLENLLHRE